MSKGRLEAFSDGVIAIIITIMVLELRPPEEPTFAALVPLLPVFLSYVLSFVFIGIYWNNHHHMLQAAERVNGRILWANIHLLFWLSIIPFVTAWVGGTGFASVPVATYGIVLTLDAIAYIILSRELIAAHGPTSRLAMAIGRDTKGKVSITLAIAAVPLAFVNPWIACGLYVIIALIWFIPDTRIEKTLDR